MDPNTPMALVAARYAERANAVQDFKEIWSAKREGELDHIAAAVLTKNTDGELQVERHDSTAKHLAWGGALLGSVLVVVAPPAGLSALALTGGLAGHFWHSIPKDQVQQASDLLESGQSGLIIVAVNRTASEIGPFVGRAEKSVLIDTLAGDLEGVFDHALEEAQRTKARA
jgi:uncharacterized membrane protein